MLPALGAAVAENLAVLMVGRRDGQETGAPYTINEFAAGGFDPSSWGLAVFSRLMERAVPKAQKQLEPLPGSSGPNAAIRPSSLLPFKPPTTSKLRSGLTQIHLDAPWMRSTAPLLARVCHRCVPLRHLFVQACLRSVP